MNMENILKDKLSKIPSKVNGEKIDSPIIFKIMFGNVTYAKKALKKK